MSKLEYILNSCKAAQLGGADTVGSGSRGFDMGIHLARDNLFPNVAQVNLKIWPRLKLCGVEMEALTAVQVALLTIYDMAKAVDRGMVMGDVHLLEKSGGKSGEWKAE